MYIYIYITCIKYLYGLHISYAVKCQLFSLCRYVEKITIMLHITLERKTQTQLTLYRE